MDTALTQTTRPVAKTLVLLLRVAQSFLVIAAILLLLIGGLFLIPNGPMSSVIETLAAEGATPPQAGALAFAFIASAITAAAWFVVLNILVKIVRTVQAGDPFVEANIARLRTMWILIAGTEIFRMIVHSAADLNLAGTSVSTADTGLDIRIGTWFLVLVIAVLSEAFRHGAAMRREQELTI
jgi:hypothetical protein